LSKVWLITGGSGGPSRLLVNLALAAGGHVAVATGKPNHFQELASRYEGRIRVIHYDARDYAGACRAVATAVSTFGRIDVLVNNGGHARVKMVEDIAELDFRRAFEINFFEIVNMTRAALRVLIGQRHGRIVQLMSIGTPDPVLGTSAYHAAKRALCGFSEVLAKEVRPLGIQVTVVEMGGVNSELEVADPANIADAIYQLASDEKDADASDASASFMLNVGRFGSQKATSMR
jgi:NAD(P)-dependent dehydrogenase (short-subunit alcohol dehydrogenase family)